VLSSTKTLKLEEKGELVRIKTQEWGECLADITEIMYERMCGLKKVRNAVKQKGIAVGKIREEQVRDCVLTPWEEEYCTDGAGGDGTCDKSCGDGCDSPKYGQAKLTRSELASPGDYGQKCADKEMFAKCGGTKCPIDCTYSPDWSPWGECAAPCNGGTRSHFRTIVRAPEYGGAACQGGEVENENCANIPCNPDCVLHEWKRTGHCTRACGGGIFEERRAVKDKAKGSGSCPGRNSAARYRGVARANGESGDRYDGRHCNMNACVNDEECVAGQDLIIAIDGSGSVGVERFATMREFAKSLVTRYRGIKFGKTRTRIGIMTFGNGEIITDTKDDSKFIQAAIGAKDAGGVKDLGITQELNDVQAAVEKLVPLNGFTNMAQAFMLAKEMFENASPHPDPLASKAVIVITDGVPSLEYESRNAAEALKEEGTRVSIVAVRPPVVGGSADTVIPKEDWDTASKLMNEFTSLPHGANFMAVGSDNLGDQAKRETLAMSVVQATCPRAVSPSLIKEAALARAAVPVRAFQRCPGGVKNLVTMPNDDHFRTDNGWLATNSRFHDGSGVSPQWRMSKQGIKECAEWIRNKNLKYFYTYWSGPTAHYGTGYYTCAYDDRWTANSDSCSIEREEQVQDGETCFGYSRWQVCIPKYKKVSVEINEYQSTTDPTHEYRIVTEDEIEQGAIGGLEGESTANTGNIQLNESGGAKYDLLDMVMGEIEEDRSNETDTHHPDFDEASEAKEHQMNVLFGETQRKEEEEEKRAAEVAARTPEQMEMEMEKKAKAELEKVFIKHWETAGEAEWSKWVQKNGKNPTQKAIKTSVQWLKQVGIVPTIVKKVHHHDPRK
jgi:Mg-chelatase subunit ChlD